VDLRGILDPQASQGPVPAPGPGAALTPDSPPATPIEIREARPEEYEEAGRVTELAYLEFARPGDESWEGYLRRLRDVRTRAERTMVLVAVDGDRVVGTATLELDHRIEPEDDPPLRPGQAEIRMVGVLPEARGRGLGRMLMEACLREARKRGKAVATLHTTRRMKVAQRMYESMGFRRGPDRVFDDGFVLLSYSLELDR
jgi:ribosomal protein S18 acetylase RimI-like enzyme